MAEDVELACRKVCAIFGIEKFNKQQEEAIRCVVLEKKDVFVNLPTGFGKSLIFQSLPGVFSSLQQSDNDGSRNIVIVVSPLISLMKDQVSRLTSIGVSAICLSDINTESERRNLESGQYSIVYGSPESWLNDERWRKMLASKAYSKFVRAVAVDEAHIISHWGKSKSNKHAAFRVWFARLHELRSLVSQAPIIALTATATKDTRETIFEVLQMREPHIIMESPNKANISYAVHYMKKNASIAEYFWWIAEEVIAHGSTVTRTIIYCQTIKQCAVIYSTLKSLLGENIYVTHEKREPKNVILEMLHACTPTTNKEHILESFQKEEGCVRVLVATIAFGMGVDCKKVHRTIHFGPAKNVECYMQESGRAGRDGTQSNAYLLYQGMQLMHVDKEMKEYVKSKDCRRKLLLQYFDEFFTQPNPAHLCCDNCSVICKCGLENCKVLTYPTTCPKPSAQEMARKRNVTDEQRAFLKTELVLFHKSLIINFLQRDASGKLKSFTHPKVLLGFSEVQVTQVLDHCYELFSISDICNLVEIWDMQHAFKIFNILTKIVTDMDGDSHTVVDDELSSDEDEDFLPEEWNDLALDEELANMAIDNLSLSQLEESNDASIDNAPSDVPFAALNAVMNLSFDAVLDDNN